MYALIGGSGFTSDDVIADREEVEIETPYGRTSAPIVIGRLGRAQVAFLRRHGRRHEYAPHLVPSRANLWALSRLHVEGVVAVGTVGGIPSDMGPGGIAVPDQLLDCTWGREVTYYDSPEAGVKHIDFTYPFDRPLSAELVRAAERIGRRVKPDGVYACTQGPRLETKAEVERLRRAGADMIGMTLYPECALARELGLAYSGICVSVNHAAGIGDSSEKIDFESLKDEVERTVADVVAVVREALEGFEAHKSQAQ